MPRDYKLYFEDILRSIEKIEEYRKGITFSKLSESNLLLDAILYNLQMILKLAQGKQPIKQEALEMSCTSSGNPTGF